MDTQIMEVPKTRIILTNLKNHLTLLLCKMFLCLAQNDGYGDDARDRRHPNMNPIQRTSGNIC